MQKEINSFKDLRSSKTFKNTRGREIILRELETRRDHFNAEKLYSSLSHKGPRVSRPTIYRTLKLLERFHLIERLDIKKNCFYYEPVLHKGDHGHLICEACGKIIDFSIGNLKTLKSMVVKEKGFRLGDISIRVFGLCEGCQRATKVSRRET